MPHAARKVSRKRQAPGTASTISGPTASPSVGSSNALIRGGRTLSYVLSKTHPVELSQVLQTAVQTATPGEIQAVTKLLSPLFPKALDKKTCLRCDKQYIEAQNADRSCQVEHCADPEDYDDEGGYFDD